jgi:hypothetical protein
LAIHGLLWLYMNCMVAFSISVKTSHWISARCWWLTPVILAASEAEIRKIMVLGQSRQNCLWDSISMDKRWAPWWIPNTLAMAGNLK